MFQKEISTTPCLLLFRIAELLEGASRTEEQAIKSKRKSHSGNSRQNLSPLSLPLMSEKEIEDNADNADRNLHCTGFS